MLKVKLISNYQLPTQSDIIGVDNFVPLTCDYGLILDMCVRKKILKKNQLFKWYDIIDK